MSEISKDDDEINHDGVTYFLTRKTLYATVKSIEITHYYGKKFNSDDYQLRRTLSGNCEAEEGGVIIIGKPLRSSHFQWTVRTVSHPKTENIHHAHLFYSAPDRSSRWDGGWFIDVFVGVDFIDTLVAEFNAGRIGAMLLGCKFPGSFTVDRYDHSGPIFLRSDDAIGSLELIRITSPERLMETGEVDRAEP